DVDKGSAGKKEGIVRLRQAVVVWRIPILVISRKTGECHGVASMLDNSKTHRLAAVPRSPIDAPSKRIFPSEVERRKTVLSVVFARHFKHRHAAFSRVAAIACRTAVKLGCCLVSE